MGKLTNKARMAAAGLFYQGMKLKDKLTGETMAQGTKAATGKIYEFSAKINGKDKSLSEYKGKVLLIVNTASLCGFTPQYDALQALHEKYAPKGLKVLAFPANEFGAQEPGGDDEIKEFCRTKFSLSFEVFDKVVVKGAGIHPLFKFLTTQSGHNGEIKWNFEKYLVGKDGEVLAHFESPADPMGKEIVGKVEAAL